MRLSYVYGLSHPLHPIMALLFQIDQMPCLQIPPNPIQITKTSIHFFSLCQFLFTTLSRWHYWWYHIFNYFSIWIISALLVLFRSINLSPDNMVKRFGEQVGFGQETECKKIQINMYIKILYTFINIAKPQVNGSVLTRLACHSKKKTLIF